MGSSGGFRFYPTEEELLAFYLRHRLAGTRPDLEHLIPVVDIYAYHPSELQAMAGAANVNDTEQWFFFCPLAERELHGGRPERTTPSGYWKAMWLPSYVYSSGSSPATSNRVIGEKRTMVFYQGRAPTGNKTRWKMNEYKAIAADDADDIAPPPAPGAPIMLRNEFSVCRVYTSTGTLRSFDRQPLNPPGGGLAVLGAQQAVHRGYQQPLLPPPAAVAATATTRHHHDHQQMLAAAVVVNDAAMPDNNGRHAAAEKSHEGSSSGSQGGSVDDGAGDAAAAIDWDSLIPPVDDLAFSGVDDLTRVIWSHN